MSDSFHIVTKSGKFIYASNSVIDALNNCALHERCGDLYENTHGNDLYVGKVLIQDECLYFAPVVDISRFKERMFYFIRFTGKRK